MKQNSEERLQRLEDIQNIACLKAIYCRAADCGPGRPARDAGTIASLFVEDGVWDAGDFGRAEGREAIRALFRTNPYAFGLHRISNPTIQVTGDTATGEWIMLCPTIIDNESVWIGGIYKDEFVRTPEGWKFKEARAFVTFTSRNEAGFDLVKAAGI